jgi:hypothetical protein
MTNIVTGEKIQQLCDIYLGVDGDFNFNPNIARQPIKHIYLHNINNPINNPYRIFCYSHNIKLLSQKIHLFKNNFILVTHNSDGEIRETPEVFTILNCDKMLKWFGQNICFQHTKLNFLPIGLANSQWSHGNLSLFCHENFINYLSIKSNKYNNVYFNFNINTNRGKRQICYDVLVNKLQWLNNIHPVENMKRLSTYKFCICPEGNGVDSHRLWECLNLRVVPIVIKSEFTNILLNQNIPLVVLDKWDDIDLNKLNYDDYNFESDNLKKILNFDNYLSYLS